MKVLLQDSQSLKYLDTSGFWSEDLQRANDFKSTLLALKELYRAPFPNTWIVLAFPDARFNISLHHHNECPALAPTRRSDGSDNPLFFG